MVSSVKPCTKTSSKLIINSNLEYIIYNVRPQFCYALYLLSWQKAWVKLRRFSLDIPKYFKIRAEPRLISICNEGKGSSILAGC